MSCFYIVMLSIVILSVIMLNVVIPSVFELTEVLVGRHHTQHSDTQCNDQ